MLTLNGNFQYIDWRHDALESEPHVGEHLGTLKSYLIIPSLTIGLSDYINFNYSQTIGVRSMNWEPEEESPHHRDETSLTDFINAIGGALGDARFKFRYLYKNTTIKEGNRVYFGLGMLIPSGNVLTESPFIEPGDPDAPDGWTGEHRHFSLSDGVYKGLIEFQIFKKRSTNPVFYGVATNIDIPIDESKYGYMPGIGYSVVSSLVCNIKKGKSNFMPIGATFGLSFVGTTEGSWHGKSTPNSESRLIIPSLGGIWNTSKGSWSLSIQKPIFLTGLGGDDDPLNNEAKAIQLVIGYRRPLGYIIPWL